MSVHAVVMAGGSGERFWPLSRKDVPKQFLAVCGETTLLQEAVRRAALLTAVENVLVVTGRAHVDLVKRQVPGVPARNIIVEPVGRDTAPCVAVAAAYIHSADPDGVMVVLPSDHLVRGDDAFVETVLKAVETARETGGLVTIGVGPTRPETGYGYILADWGAHSAPGRALRVERFVEKPPIERAREYLETGKYLWNSGMFVWTVGAIRAAIERHAPDIAAGLRPFEEALAASGDARAALDSCFPSLRRVSIDYGVMEHASNVWVVPAGFEWDDVGGWAALDRVLPGDERGNRVRGRALAASTTDSIVWSCAPGRLVAAFGLDGAVVVDTPDAVLVTSKERAPHLKDLLSEIQACALSEHLSSPSGRRDAVAGTADGRLPLSKLAHELTESCRFVEKPWGGEIWWAVTDSYAAKLLQVRAGHSLSLQYHRKKHETMMFIEGTARMRLGDGEFDITPPRVVDVAPGTVHRVTAVTDVLIVEVSTPDLDDIVRLEDSYGRS